MEAFVIVLTIFVLAMFVGFEVITKVPPTLHTPLMSGSSVFHTPPWFASSMVSSPRTIETRSGSASSGR